MTRWEYQIFAYTEMAKRGTEGWEAYSVVAKYDPQYNFGLWGITTEGVMVFAKRPLPSDWEPGTRR